MLIEMVENDSKLKNKKSVVIIITTELTAILIKVNLTENLTLLSPQHWILEKVKKVKTGSSMREG